MQEDFGSLEIRSLRVNSLRSNLKSYFYDSEIHNFVVYPIFIKMGIEKKEIFLFLDRDPGSKYHLRGL